MPRTRRVDSSGPGIRRRRRGPGFSYHEEDGELITDGATLERIDALAIPPAWRDVWISPDARGHLQATGYDDAGRKQYLYHEDWRAHRDRLKFDEMLTFARGLPTLRARVSADLDRRGLVFERVCGCAVALLDLGLFRVGGERYERENSSFGLVTLKARHLNIDSGAALFVYPGKSGRRARHRIAAPEVMPTLRALKRHRDPAEDLLAYRVGRGEWVGLSSERVNDYIKEEVGEGFSAKDFRTWNATVLCAVFLAAHADQIETRAARKRIANLAVRETAEYLNNTPAVCRASYIDPRLFDCLDSGETIRPALSRIERGTDPGRFVEREAIERAVIRLLG